MTFAECCLSLLVATKIASKQSARNVSHVLCSSRTHGVCVMWFQVNDNATRHQSISMNFTNHKQLHLLFFSCLDQSESVSALVCLRCGLLRCTPRLVMTSGQSSECFNEQQTQQRDHRSAICFAFSIWTVFGQVVNANALPESERIRSRCAH